MLFRLVDEEEFLSIKDPLVEDVLGRLRHLARQEASLLFRTPALPHPLSPRLQPPSPTISSLATRMH